MKREQAEKIVLGNKTREQFIEEQVTWFSVTGDAGCEPEEAKAVYRKECEENLEAAIQREMMRAYPLV